ncbi:hypothetical protein [Bizionia myxarmorum]|uniref:Uncharacterized protein n=1 Tax=Bizionia myxarmorum TaxID=291186 RepID=A0A5D0RDW8_9FLAO|nr:hypothetical protein [Bizionia myxarmorum]TYB78945.1 hypothetical protein ES674_03995 [Bizionia myxarmorum]
MKLPILKTLSILIILSSSTTLFSQTQPGIKDSVLLNIPNIGKIGGAHLLNWSFNTDKSEIFLYAYSHINGSQIISSKEEIEAAKKENDEKSFFGKMVSTSGPSSQDIIIPVVLEGSIMSSDMSIIATKKYLFHKTEGLPEGKNVFFKPASGMVSLDGFAPGTLLDYNYSDINTVFKYAPTLDKELLSLTELKVKGEGFLGTKNMSPWITKKKAFFKYVDNKGYVSDVETKDIINLKDNPELTDYEFLRESDNSAGSNYISWFVKEKDDADYKTVTYNEETQKMTVQSFKFDTPRNPKTLTKTVYNKELEPVGFATIFGYHKKGKKSETYVTTDFDIIYTDLAGTVKFQTKFSYGSEKTYKNVVSPILIINEGNDVLQFVNHNQQSLMKSDFEVFTLDASGKTNLVFSDIFSAKQGETYIRYFDYLVDYDAITKMGTHYILRKNNTKKSTESIPNSTLQKEVILNEGFNYTVLDSNFKPVRFDSYNPGTPQKDGFGYQYIDVTDNQFTSLSERAGRYYLTTITPNSINTISLKTDLGKNSSQMLYFGSYMSDFALVNKENKEFFILHQYYTADKVLDKVAIIKVGY